MQFLPEGGHLVTGLTSRVAFKAVNSVGQGLAVKGFVLDAKKDTVIGFTTTHLGMGYFMLKPEPAQVYTAFVTAADGTLASYPIPAVQEQGVVMQVENLTNKDNVLVYVMHNKTITDTAATLTLVAQARGQIIQVAKIPVIPKNGHGSITSGHFPGGYCPANGVR